MPNGFTLPTAGGPMEKGEPPRRSRRVLWTGVIVVAGILLVGYLVLHYLKVI